MKVTLLRLELTVREPFAIAAPESAEGGADRPVSTDIKGRPVVPASSVTGSLRHHVQRFAEETAGFPDRLVRKAFGPTPRRGEDEGTASSRLRIVGTRLRRNGEPVERRDLINRKQTQIDRERRAADSHTLRSSLLVPAGAVVEVFARIDDEGDEDWALNAEEQQALLEAIGTWQPVLGWGRNIGMGRAELTKVWEGVLDLDNRPEDLRTWLLKGGPELHEDVAVNEVSVNPPQRKPWRQYRFEIVDALHIAGDPDDSDKIEGNGKAGNRSGQGQRGGPESSGADGQKGRRSSNEILLWKRDGQPVIEGSSLKGVVRSRAEYVLASLGVEEPDKHPLIQHLFGTTEKQGRLIFRSSPVRDAKCEKRPHVAIDRVTGGARDRHLYTLEVAVQGTFGLVIDYDYAGDRRSDGDPTEAPSTVGNRGGGDPLGAEGAGALVDAVIRDLHDGLIGIGGHTSSGHGTVQLVDSAACPEPSGARLEEIASLPPSPPPDAETVARTAPPERLP